ncbi:MAG: hypothetical protein QXS93_04075 [Candidatus Micrarchaeia archaeon]
MQQNIQYFLVALVMFATLANAVQVECIPASASNNTLVLEKVCESRLHASCACRPAQGGAVCVIDLKEDLIVSCDGNSCKAKLLGEETDIGRIQPSSTLVQIMCKSISGAECKCANSDEHTVSCSIRGAKIYSTCDKDGCTFKLGDKSKSFGFCDPIPKIAFEEHPSKGLTVSLGGTVVNEEDGHLTLQDGILSITGTLDSGLGVEIAADLDSVNENSLINAQRAELNDQVREKFKQAIQLRYNNTAGYSALDAIEVNMHNLLDGVNIKSATLRFKVPKEQVSGEVVILRYTDDGRVEVLTPTVSEIDGYYIYEVHTDGLSLYAMVTINQISEPLSQTSSTSTDIAPRPQGCGTAAVVLAFVMLLYVAIRTSSKNHI